MFENDPLAVTVFDPDHSTYQELRYTTIGYSTSSRLIRITHTETDELREIISVRKAQRIDREIYDNKDI